MGKKKLSLMGLELPVPTPKNNPSRWHGCQMEGEWK